MDTNPPFIKADEREEDYPVFTQNPNRSWKGTIFEPKDSPTSQGLEALGQERMRPFD